MSVGFAKKIGMTRLFVEGKAVPVTAIQFNNSYVIQRKSSVKDGYNSVQVGSVTKRKVTKSLGGHISKYVKSATGFRFISEFRDLKIEDAVAEFNINDFSEGDELDISGKVIGRGFTGVVKRWGFHGQPKSHGHDHERAPGSIGSRWPQRTVIGKKMAGHTGANTKTLKKVKVIAIDKEQSLLFLNGSIPGSNSGYLKIRKVNI
jgi:large subunit ribosomal protein L3